MECSLYYKVLYIKGGQSQNLEAYTPVAASSKSFSVQNDLEILAAIAGVAPSSRIWGVSSIPAAFHLFNRLPKSCPTEGRDLRWSRS